MNIITWKKYAGQNLLNIDQLNLQNQGFTLLGKITKPANSEKTVIEFIENFVKNQKLELVVYQAVTRKKGEYKITVYGK